MRSRRRTDDDMTCWPARAGARPGKEFAPLAQSVLEESHQEKQIAMPTLTDLHAANPAADAAPTFELDFESDEPLPVCPMRQDGSGPDEACEACQ
jgi:uncharacterized protein (DUF1800 family)